MVLNRLTSSTKIDDFNKKKGSNSKLSLSSRVVSKPTNGFVPWKLRNRWFNCLELTKTMHFRVTHIYREGNCCADKMAALGINVDGFYWWDNVPPSVQGDYISNLMGLPSFRFH
ncbi:unnamed protein product [Trifolium pratense]|uniref:Uncharacterized protein n=1 Tax=Trifolium pratense TaxID=57577 RepID=A0ACB0LXJ2_TRIPR|nr:unnamed protein product [Trifolium pratense]